MRPTQWMGWAPSLLVAGAVLAPAAAAAQVPLVVWHAYRAGEKAAFEKVVEEYNRGHAGAVKVTTLAVPYDAYADKITAAVPRGTGPDIFIYAQDRLGGWIEAGNTIEPIDFYLEDATKERFLPKTLEAMTYHSTIYGLPLNYKVIAQIFNRKLVAQAPQTATELVAVAKKLSDPASGRFGLAYPYSDFYYHAALMNAFGGSVFGPDGRPALNSAANLRALDYLLGWIDRDRILPAEPSVALITALFNDGKAGIVFSGPWFLGEIAAGIDYGIAPLPTLAEAGGPMKPWMTVEGVFIAASSKHKDQAYDFLKFATDLPAARLLALEGRQTPANQAVYRDPQVASDAVLSAFRKQVEVAVPMPNLPEMTMVWSPATTAMNVIVKKSAAPQAAMDQAQREVVERIGALRR